MLRGSCLCGAVRFEIDAELGQIVCCHCSQCRKAQGGAFATNASVPAAAFRLVQGEDRLRAFESSPGKERVFCSVCGSPILSRRSSRPDAVRVRLGTLDSPVSARPSAHIFAGSKADWWEIRDELPQYDGVEPARAKPGG